jgi:hypothetical protein
MLAERENDRQRDVAKQTGEVPSIGKAPVKAKGINKETNGTKIS